MSEKYKLKVPSEVAQEFVGQGNFHAELKPNSTIETTSRSFADFLIREHGLTEVLPKKAKAEEEKEIDPFAKGYAENFPGRDALIAAKIPFDSARGLTRETLLKVQGIGEQTADQILNYTPQSLVPVPATNDPAGGNIQNDSGNAADSASVNQTAGGDNQ